MFVINGLGADRYSPNPPQMIIARNQTATAAAVDPAAYAAAMQAAGITATAVAPTGGLCPPGYISVFGHCIPTWWGVGILGVGGFLAYRYFKKPKTA